MTSAGVRIMIRNRTLQHRQQGAASLLIALVLLVGVTLITLYTAQTMIMEQRIAANDIRAREAFEAAEAGRMHGARYADMPGANMASTLAEDLDSDGTDDYSVTFLSLGSGRYQIQSQGWSFDRTATATVFQQTGTNAYIANTPQQPLITRSFASDQGNVAITNNYTNQTVWSGGEFSNIGSADTYINVNGTDNVKASDKNNVGPDVIQNDPNLANATDHDFFNNFFSMSMSEMQASANFNSLPNDPADAAGSLIWIDGDLSMQSNGVYGSADEPVILIVDGDLSIHGGPEIWGIVYVTGNMNSGGNPDIYGSAIVAGNVTGNGTVDIIYTPSVFNPSEPLGEDIEVAGTWRDW